MRFLAVPMLLLLLPAARPAIACGVGDPLTGVPDLNQSIVTWDFGGSGPATLLVMPDGSGPPLTAARLPGGALVDATIHLRLIDGCGDPIANFPRDDMWLEPLNGGLVACVGGTTVDQNTDVDGRTHWAQPLRAGGHSQTVTYVVVNGAALAVPGVPLHFVSPDLNGDRVVSLADVAQFAAAYFGAYAFAADLRHDGVVNLSDVSILAGSAGAHCP